MSATTRLSSTSMGSGTPVMLSREWHVSEAFDVRINRKANTLRAVAASTTA